MILDLADSFQVLATACSCTGSPSYALKKLVGPGNFTEPISSEKHVARIRNISDCSCSCRSLHVRLA